MNKLIYILFLTGLFFFPFNSFRGWEALGEFKNEAGAYFFLFGFLLLAFNKRTYIPLNNKVFIIMLFFFGWCILTTILNFNGVASSHFKATSGISRFVRQFFSLMLSGIIFFLFYYNMLKRMEIKVILVAIRKVFFFSLIFASVLGFFEALVGIFGISAAKAVVDIFNFFPFVEKTYFTVRISSIADEPPLLAIYLITISGWMFSYIKTNKGWSRNIPTILIFLLTFYSGSRTALIIVVLQGVLFFISINSPEKIIRYLVSASAVLLVVALTIFVFNAEKIVKAIDTKIESLDFKSNLKNNVSNQSRFGMQLASLEVFYEHPIKGVGFGQQTYYSRFHYPVWAVRNNYEFKIWYMNKSVKAFPPGYNIYTRLLAETGLIGVLILLYLAYYSIRHSWRIKNKGSGEKNILALILYISLIGLFINWMTIDTFRLYGIWLSLALLIRLSNEKTVVND